MADGHVVRAIGLAAQQPEPTPDESQALLRALHPRVLPRVLQKQLGPRPHERVGLVALHHAVVQLLVRDPVNLLPGPRPGRPAAERTHDEDHRQQELLLPRHKFERGPARRQVVQRVGHRGHVPVVPLASHRHAKVGVQSAAVLVVAPLYARGVVRAGDLEQPDAALDAVDYEVPPELGLLLPAPYELGGALPVEVAGPAHDHDWEHPEVLGETDCAPARRLASVAVPPKELHAHVCRQGGGVHDPELPALPRQELLAFAGLELRGHLDFDILEPELDRVRLRPRRVAELASVLRHGEVRYVDFVWDDVGHAPVQASVEEVVEGVDVWGRQLVQLADVGLLRHGVAVERRDVLPDLVVLL
ncbi:hypothetical protein THAOC_31930 [Thalassiosira oceanica]|uniref:Uncharacterized protein n=1 Tax=Thalassiosira oceanica TaxID=159749 RepID=K0RRI0_THAOC|nr:hypothetical protein THAOC_31930 [Thalassiosira oceanica]|eukprot:EJK49227.1 hypothetical protein THAOC_31930 [Thalassiosira oceanica]